MNSKYSINNCIFVIINNNKYVLYKHVTEKMGIFNVLQDVKLKDDECMNISCDATTEIIEYVLDAITEKQFCGDTISISHLIEIITLMKYFATDPDLIYWISKEYLEKFFFTCTNDIFLIMEHFKIENMINHSEIEYLLKILAKIINKSDNREEIFDTYHEHNIGDFIHNNFIIQKHFSSEFKNCIVKFMVIEFIDRIMDDCYRHLSHKILYNEVSYTDSYNKKIDCMKKIHNAFNIKNNIISFLSGNNYIESVLIDDYVEEIKENTVNFIDISIRYITGILLGTINKN
jgi:hypothetical protein